MIIMPSRSNRTRAIAVGAILVTAVTWPHAWAQTEGKLPGLWEGTLEFPGFATRVVFKFETLPDGTLRGMLLRPDQGDDEIAFSKLVLDADRLHLEIDAAQASFEGRLNPQQQTIEGHWRQGAHTLPLVLKKVTHIRRPNRPQTPKPPYPYDQHQVVFTNTEAPARLAGTLTVPRERRPVPAVLLISGGGPQDRDVTILDHRFFLVLADYLTRRGIAVLRADDRGVGRSTGDRSNATSEDFAQDALAGVDFLRQRPEIDPSKIGLIGHSEGGAIAALAAAQSPDVAFIVMLASPGLAGEAYHLQFEASAGRALGQSEAAIAAKLDMQKRIFAALNKHDQAAAEAEIRRILSELDPPLPEERIEAGVRRFASPWFRFSVTHDPGSTLNKLRCPVLALFGEKDVQVPPTGNAEAVSKALKQTGHADHRVEVLPNLNHFLQTAETGAPDEYGRIEQTMSPTALAAIADWIQARTK